MFLTRDLVNLLLERSEAAMAKDEFSRQLLLMGFPLTEVFPLPPSLVVLFQGIPATDEMPAASAIQNALAQAAEG